MFKPYYIKTQIGSFLISNKFSSTDKAAKMGYYYHYVFENYCIMIKPISAYTEEFAIVLL